MSPDSLVKDLSVLSVNTFFPLTLFPNCSVHVQLTMDTYIALNFYLTMNKSYFIMHRYSPISIAWSLAIYKTDGHDNNLRCHILI